MSKANKTPAIGSTVSTTVATDNVERITVPGGFVITNHTTGAVHFETDSGEKTEVKPANKAPEPEKPKPVPGKLVIGEDGVQRFVPDDGSDPLDLTKAIEARDAEAKLTASEKATREIEKNFQVERERIQSLMTDKEKVAALTQQAQQLYNELQTSNAIVQRLKLTVLGQSLMLSEVQIGK